MRTLGIVVRYTVGHYLRRGGNYQEPYRGEHAAWQLHHQQERRRQRLVYGDDSQTHFRQERSVQGEDFPRHIQREHTQGNDYKAVIWSMGQQTDRKLQHEIAEFLYRW